MATVPNFDATSSPPTPAAEPVADLVALVAPRARQSFAAWSGEVAGAELTYSDRQAAAVYLGGGLPPTRNRGGRPLTGTRRRGSDGAGSALWRL